MNLKKRTNLATILITIFIISTLNVTILNDFQVQAAIPTDCSQEMVAYWKLDEVGSPTVFADSFNGHNGGCSSFGCPTPTTGIVDGAQAFPGASTGVGIVVPSHTDFDWAAGDSFTIELWMKRTGTIGENDVIVGRDDVSTSLHWWVGLEKTTGKPLFYLVATNGDVASIKGNTNVNDNNWHHLVYMKDGNNLKVYVDGVEDATPVAKSYAAGFGSTADLNIGWLYIHNKYSFDGIADEIAIYSRALSWPEIQYHYILGLDGLGYCEPSLYGCDEPVDIMPLGDSITMGNSLESTDPLYYKGYRAPLWYELQDNGYYVDFVGSLEHGQNVIPSFDIDHEGHGGKTASWLNARLVDDVSGEGPFLIDNPPDIILYHIGTNNLGGSDIAAYAADVDTSLDIIYDFDPTITVILARITLTRDADRNIRTHNYNDLIENIAHDWADLGYSIIVVDIENALTYPDDLALPNDNLHPNQVGYDKMAGVWFEALQVLLPVCFPTCPDGLVSYWKLDETSGTVFDDYFDGNDGSGSGHNPTPATGIVGGAQDFDGSSQYITVEDDDSLDWGATDSFTVELWGKFTNAATRNKVMIGRDTEGGEHWWLGANQPTGYPNWNMKATDGSGGAVTGTTAINDDVWHYIVAVRDESVNQNRLYVDGALAGQATYDYTAGFGATTTLGIGYMAYHLTPDYFYDGLLDEIAIYDRALTLDEIECHYNEGSGRDYCEECPTEPPPPTECPENMISYWKLDETVTGTYEDYYGNNDGVCAGTCPTPDSSGKINGAQSFNRAEGKAINVPDNYNEFDWPAGASFSIEFWMKHPAGCTVTGAPMGNEVIVGRDDHGLEPGNDIHWWVGVECHTDPGKIMFNLLDRNRVGMNVEGSTNVINGGWHHVVAVKERVGSTDYIRIYVDGNLDGVNDAHLYTAGFDSINPIEIGHMGNEFYYTGLIDEVAIYNKALTLAEVQDHWNDGAGKDYCESVLPPTECPDGMNSYWKLDETGGSPYVDFYDGNDGACSGTCPSAVSGIIGGAQQFSTGTGINVPGTAYNWAADDSFTIEFWMFMNTATTTKNNVIIGRDDGSTSLHWWVGLKYSSTASERDKAMFVLRDRNRNPGNTDGTSSQGILTGTSVLTDGVWHHIVAMKERSGGVDYLHLYVDGVEEAVSSSYTWTAPFDSNAALEIGHLMGADWYYRGILDELAVYNRALTLDEIECHYNEGSGRDYCEECPTEPPPPTECPEDMISYWNFDDCVSPYEDYLADNDATCTNCPDCTPGIVDNAVQFNGVDDAVSVVDDDSFDWGVGQSFSIEYWMKSTSGFSGNEVIIGRQGPTHPQPHIWTGGHDDGDQAIFVLFDSSGSNGGNDQWPKSGTDISDGQWHHIVAVKDSTHIRIYVDGVEKQAVPKTYPAGFGSTTNLNIGWLNLGSGYYYEGALDEVALYNRALTLTEIQQHYTNGLAGYGYCEAPEETSTSTATFTESETFTETVTVTLSDTVTQSDTVTESFTETVTQASTETVYAAIEMLSGEVHVVVGGTSGVTRGKPAGTAYAAWIDSTAGGALLGMSEDGHFCWDTDTSYIDPSTGEPTGVPAGATLVASGGPLVNGPVKYYEVNRIAEGTPAYYGKVGGLQSFLRSSDDSVLAGLTPTSTNDLFIIEIFTDSEGRNIILIYGLAGRGTLAGALYFADNADFFDGKSGFWIYEWTDSGAAGAEGHPDPPGTDTYNLINSG